MSAPRVLIAGIGNIFLGDDAFGCEVVRRLSNRRLPAGVRVVDFGIRGLDLAYALLGGYELAVLVDALPLGQRPGTLYRFEPRLEDLGARDGEAPPVEPHAMAPTRALALAKSMGGRLPEIAVIGCEPEPVGEDGARMGLSARVEAAVDEAVAMVESLVASALAARARKAAGEEP